MKGRVESMMEIVIGDPNYNGKKTQGPPTAQLQAPGELPAKKAKKSKIAIKMSKAEPTENSKENNKETDPPKDSKKNNESSDEDILPVRCPNCGVINN